MSPDLTDVSVRLQEVLSDCADEWGALGVLNTAAAMWPDALAAMTAPVPRPAEDVVRVLGGSTLRAIAADRAKLARLGRERVA
jgi:hypothetical protein